MTSLEWTDEGFNEGGVQERQFVIKDGRGPVPGIMWTPELVKNPLPLVLFGHGGSGHKRNDRSLMLGRRLASIAQFAVVAVDGPAHGDRAHPRSESEGVDPMEIMADLGVDAAARRGSQLLSLPLVAKVRRAHRPPHETGRTGPVKIPSIAAASHQPRADRAWTRQQRMT